MALNVRVDPKELMVGTNTISKVWNSCVRPRHDDVAKKEPSFVQVPVNGNIMRYTTAELIHWAARKGGRKVLSAPARG